MKKICSCRMACSSGASGAASSTAAVPLVPDDTAPVAAAAAKEGVSLELAPYEADRLFVDRVEQGWQLTDMVTCDGRLLPPELVRLEIYIDPDEGGP